MEKEKLHRFFAGTTSIQEGMDIRAWMEASEENKRIFYKERKLFDALMVHDDQTTNNCISTKRIPKIIRQWLKIASVIILTLTINYLYQKYKSENEVIIRKTKCFDFWERNVLFPKTKRSFFRTPKHPLPCPFPLNFSLLIITKKFGNLAKNRYICIV